MTLLLLLTNARQDADVVSVPGAAEDRNGYVGLVREHINMIALAVDS